MALLKGPTTAVADPIGRVLLAMAGTTALATAGTGDVLSGVIGAMLARGVDPLEAAALAAHVHGRAGARGRGEGLVAGDLPDLVAEVLSRAALGGRDGPWLTAGGRPGPTSTSTPCATTPRSWPAGRARPPCARWSRPTATATGPCRWPGPPCEGGATWLAVALVEEGVALREAGIEAPILLLSEPPVEAMAEAVARRLVPTVYTDGGLERLSRAGGGRAVPRSRSISRWTPACTGWAPTRWTCPAWPPPSPPTPGSPSARCGPTWPWPRAPVRPTASSPPPSSTGSTPSLAALAAAGHRPPMTHVANSAGAIGVPAARHDLVRCGIALYGVAPTPALADEIAAATGGGGLRPVLSLRTRVTYVRDLDAGERPSYGRRRPLEQRSTVATAPIGYADGVPRRLFDQGGEVLIGGVRRPLAGVVTMDQVVIDCGPVGPAPVEVGDEVVLLGRQGTRRSPPTSGPACSAPSATRCCATSARGCPGSPSKARSG